MKRSSNVWLFFGTALVAFLAITAVWMQVNAWTSAPAGKIAAFALQKGASSWVQTADIRQGHMEVETRVEVKVPGQTRAQGIAYLIAEIDTAHFAYGLPLFLALLVASRSRRFLRNATIGYAVLQFTQAFSLVFGILAQIVKSAGGAGELGVAQWQLEAIVLAYQFGSLLLPALAPALIWLWLEKNFFAAVMVDGVLAQATQETRLKP